MRFALCLLACVFVFTAAAGAQAPVPAPSASPPPPAQSSSAINPAYIKEARAFLKSCTAKPEMSFYYNCDCLAARLLDERVKNGARTSQSTIILSLSGECHDATLSAGYEYQSCLQETRPSSDMPDPERYCTCFVNNFAKMYERSKIEMNSRTMVAWKTRAALLCTNPSLARQLYPYTP